MRVSQVDEADDYAWTPDTVKMSLDPRHLACGGVSVINIFSFGIYDTRGGIPWIHSCGAMPVVYNTLHVACVIWKCWLEWQGKSRGWCSSKKSEQVPLGSDVSSCFCHCFQRTLRVSRVCCMWISLSKDIWPNITACLGNVRAGGGFVQSVTECSVRISPHYVAYVEGLSLVDSLIAAGLNLLLIVRLLSFFCRLISDSNFSVRYIKVDVLYSSHEGRFLLCGWECVCVILPQSCVCGWNIW